MSVFSSHFSPSYIPLSQDLQLPSNQNDPPFLKNKNKKKQHQPRRQRIRNLAFHQTKTINKDIIMSLQRTSSTSSSTTTTTTTTTTTQACAACKYQRRKCAPDCILAPYFPYDRRQQFLNAHKLFGVSNITKIIKNLNPPDKDEAMRTIIYQSDARAHDPVGGCCRIIRELQREIEYNKAELDLVLQQLSICRAQAQQQQQEDDNSSTLNQFPVQETEDSSALVNTDTLDLYDPVLQYQYTQPDQEQVIVQDIKQTVQDLPEGDVDVNVNVDAWTSVQDSSTSSSSSLQNKQSVSFVNDQQSDDDHIKPLLDINDAKFDNDVKFEAEDLVKRRFVPSTQLLISS